MSDITTALQEAYESAGYGVDTVSDNRGQIRVILREDSASADELRRIATEVCSEDAVVGLDVTTESSAGDTEVITVVSFRHRP